MSEKDIPFLQGKSVLITGAARRIGALVAKVLHAEGANVVIHYRNSGEDADALAAGLNRIRSASAFTVRADLCKTGLLPGVIGSAIDQTGRLDVLINNASGFYPTAVGSITEQDWDGLLCSNMKAPLFLAQAAAEELARNNGCIVNMADIHGVRPLKGYPVYCAAKAGLIMLTKSLARELGPAVRVNAIAPGAILWPEDEENQPSRQELLARTALKREGEPMDIARAIRYLICDAPYVTGHVIPVDGGRMLHQ